tara:strand:+ start:1323 stop:2228 length:906 start_codon:yes stop_codon:yes gene_type:complete
MNNNTNENLSLKDFMLTLWDKKLFIFIVSLSFAIFSVFFALSIPNKYASSALLIPNQSDVSNAGMLNQLSGMASLAGITLPTESNDRSTEAIEKIKSFEFFDKHFLSNISLENLMAVRDWEYDTNTIIYDENIFNSSKGEWIREVSYPKKTIPSAQEAFKTYNTILNISQDTKTSFVYLTVKHHSPFIAQKWAEIIISEINNSMRISDKDKALKSIEFLNNQLPRVNYEEIRVSIAKLQEEQMKSLMLIESNDDYVFQTLDSPIVPEIKSSPNRALICFLITLFGFIFSLLIIVIRHHREH